MRQSSDIARRATIAGLKAAVHRSKPLSRAGMLERLFTLAFKRLVYPQIWEDPVVDMKALDIGPGHQVIAIASGGCNVLSYLTADPAGDHRGRSQRGAYCARPAQDLRGSEPAGLRQLLPLLRPRRRARQRRRLRSPAARKARPCRPRLLGQAHGVRSPPHRPLRPQFLSPRPARACPRRRPHACAPAWPRPVDRAQGQDARRAARAVREAPCADLRQAARPLALEAARVPLWAGDSAGPIQGSGRRFAREELASS